MVSDTFSSVSIVALQYEQAGDAWCRNNYVKVGDAATREPACGRLVFGQSCINDSHFTAGGYGRTARKLYLRWQSTGHEAREWTTVVQTLMSEVRREWKMIICLLSVHIPIHLVVSSTPSTSILLFPLSNPASINLDSWNKTLTTRL